MKSYRLNRKAKGFGLLEVILVFAIVIGAAAVVFTVFQSAKPSADSSNEGSNVSTIATNLKSTYGIAGDYSSLTDISKAVAAKAIPASMVANDGTVTNSWGGAVSLVGAARTFDITYAGVPSDACAKLVNGVAGFFPKGIKVNGASVMDTTTTSKVDASKVATNCGAADPVAIVFTGN